jgi:hypothetical protein
VWAVTINEAALPLGEHRTIQMLARPTALQEQPFALPGVPLLYHNLEHTLLVTLVGRDILRGRMMCERIEPDDYSHVAVACLLHDIGYVRGVLKHIS